MDALVRQVRVAGMDKLVLLEEMVRLELLEEME
jgi:hypothetical protein